MSAISGTTPVTPAVPPVTTPSTSSAVDPSGTASLANEQTFLQLLVAQIQNQDPTNPEDSTQFLTQLAQFSQVEQLVGIHSDTQNLVTDANTLAAQNAAAAQTTPAQPSTGGTTTP